MNILNKFAITFSVFKHELKQIFKDQGIVMFLIVVPLLYPVLYSWMYNNEVLKDVPTAFVDNSNSFISREFISRCDATEGIKVVGVFRNLSEAQEFQKEQKCHGIVFIPSDFAKEINRGNQGVVSFFADLSGMFYYKGIFAALTDVALEMGKNIRLSKAINYTNKDEDISSQPLIYKSVSLFNPQGGYGSFLLPAVLILILQQTLILGIGMMAGTNNEKLKYLNGNNAFCNVIGKTFSYFFVYVVVASYVLLLVPHWFDFIQLASAKDLVLFITPYLLASILFAMMLSYFVKERENVMLLFVFTSMPFLLLSGISWPYDAMPIYWKILSYIVPSTFGVNGFIKLNSFGANLVDINHEFIMLWLQCVVYLSINLILMHIKNKKNILNKE